MKSDQILQVTSKVDEFLHIVHETIPDKTMCGLPWDQLKAGEGEVCDICQQIILGITGES